MGDNFFLKLGAGQPPPFPLLSPFLSQAISVLCIKCQISDSLCIEAYTL